MADTPALQSPGLGSGLDISGIVSQLMAIERRPITALDQREQTYRTKLSAYGALKSMLSGLQSAAQGLKDTSKFNVFKTSVGDDKVLSVSASTSAVAGSYSVEVSALAQSQQLTKGGFSSSAAVIGTGTLRIELGSYAGGVFTVNAAKTPKDIVIDSTNSTLAGIRDAINASGAGVSATIVNGVGGSQLFLTANDTGLTNAIRLTTTDADGNNVDAAGLSQLVYDPTTAGGNVANLTEAKPAQNAALKINGIDVSSASNSVSSAVDGLTLNLLKTNVGSPTSIGVNKDTAAIKVKIEAFVKSYNDLNKAVGELTAFNATTRAAAPLNGDSAARTVQSQLRSVLTNPVANGSGGYSRLSEVGITFQTDGSLAIDSTKLQAALDDPSKDLSTLFIASGTNTGYAAAMDKAIDALLDTDGVISGRTDGINNSIRDLGKQRDALERRMQDTEKRLRAQFTALDAAVSRMQNTSTYLQRQLDALLPTQSRN